MSYLKPRQGSILILSLGVIVSLGVSLLLLHPAGVLAVEGTLEDIVLGQSTSLTGSATVAGPRFNAGLRSAFYEVNNQSGKVNGRLITLHTLDDQYLSAVTAANVAAQIAAYPEMIAFVGFVGSATTAAALPLMAAASIPVIGPFTGSSVFRKTFTPWTINIRAGYDDEALAMLRLFTTVKRYRRISMVYQNDGLGAPAKEAIVASMESMKMSLTSLHPYTYSDLSSDDYDFAGFAADVWQHQPQGIIMFGVGKFTTPFLEELYKVMTYPIHFVTGSWSSAERTYLKDNGLDPTNFYQTQVMPHPTLSTSVIAQEYRAAMTIHSDTDFDYVSMEGYITGRLTIEALRRTPSLTPSLNRSDFVKAIYDTKLFTIGDILMGPFSNDCLHDPGTAKGRSSMCYCNQGLREVHSMVLTKDYEYEPIDDLTYPMTECYATQDIIQRPVPLATLIPANTTTAAAVLPNSAASLINMGLAINADTNAQAVAETTMVVMGEPNATAQILYDLGEDTLLFGAIGGMEVSSQDDYPVFPIFDTAETPLLISESFQRTQIHLLATLQQQTFVQAAFVAQTTIEAIAAAVAPPPSYIFLSEAAAKVQNDQGLTIEMSIKKALQTEGAVDLSGVHTITYSSTVSAQDPSSFFAALASLPTAANLWVFGLGASSATAEFEALLDKMENSAEINVFLTFNDFSLRYSDLESRYGANSTAEVLMRLRFSTNLPLWTGNTNFATEFRAAFASSSGTNHSSSLVNHPLYFAGYVISRVLQYVLVRTNGDATPGAFIDELYQTSVVSIEGLLLGPFISADDCGGGASGTSSIVSTGCEACNIGPRIVELYSVSSLMKGNISSSDQTIRFGQCYPIYTLDSPTADAAPLLWWVAIVAVVLVSVGLMLAIHLRKQSNGDARDVSNAPTEGEVTILFTDIQDSTTLWSNYTASMALSLDIHHAVIRRCIKAHRGYEVKTAGDAFMIATKTPEAALAIAKGIQIGLMEEKWPQCITQHYLDEEFDDDPELLQSAPRRAAWHGCRVRIGIHTGTPTITLDEVTKGYDYYGNDVNLAARIEAAASGGQILTSEATKNILLEKDQDLRWLDQGHILPRGLSHPHAVFSANVINTGLGSRVFPKLTVSETKKSLVDLEGGPLPLLPPTESRDDTSSRSHGSSVPTINKDHEFVRIIERLHDQFNGEVPSALITAAFEDRLQFVQLLLKPLPRPKQGATLETVCQGWRIPYDGGNNTTPTLHRLISRMLPVEKNKLVKDASVAQQQQDVTSSLHGPSGNGSTTTNHLLDPADVNGGGLGPDVPAEPTGVVEPNIVIGTIPMGEGSEKNECEATCLNDNSGVTGGTTEAKYVIPLPTDQNGEPMTEEGDSEA